MAEGENPRRLIVHEDISKDKNMAAWWIEQILGPLKKKRGQDPAIQQRSTLNFIQTLRRWWPDQFRGRQGNPWVFVWLAGLRNPIRFPAFRPSGAHNRHWRKRSKVAAGL
jgi:hypothetical protein